MNILSEYPDVLSVTQVARILTIGKNSAYALIRRNEIGYRRIGKKIIIPKACLIDYINSARILNNQ